MDIVINEGVFDGNHESTRAILQLMPAIDFSDKDAIDIGCGNGILSVYAAVLGAKHITALDHDSRAADNTKQSLARNDVINADVYWSDFMETNLKADIIIANLPRESILMCLPKMSDSLNDGGVIIASWYKQNPKEALTADFEIIDCIEGVDYDCYVLKKG